MKNRFIAVIGTATAVLALGVQAGTEQVSSTAHWVQIDPGTAVEMPNGAKGRATMRAHATVIQGNGELSSQWCTGHQGVGPTGQAGGAGYCTVFSDNGDMLYVSYMLGGDQGGQWTVMGGTGRYMGASGSGTTTVVSRRADGQAWTSTSKGTITTK